MIENSGLIQPALEGNERLLAFLSWVKQEVGLKVENWEALAGDASARRYLRIWTPDGSFIGMIAPPSENLSAFLKVAELLRGAEIRVPQVYGHRIEQGWMLLEDFGDRAYLQEVANPERAEKLYAEALQSLYRLQTRIDSRCCGLPMYAQALLERELEIFREWLIERWLGMEIPKTMWQATAALLIDSALEQPKVVVHRDYHSRNLMVLPEGMPGVLDFQDAVVGPLTYDVVSLLRDCYFAWPKATVERWREAYRRQLAASGIEIPPHQWERWFDRMGVQRHLKAAGIFARLWLRDRRPGYLKDIPRTLGYVVEVAQKEVELQELGEFLTRQVLPQVFRKLAR